MSTKRHTILGIPIDALTQAEVLERLKNAVSAKLSTQVVTVNPEFIVRAQKDSDFRRVLKNAQLNVADGIGIRAAATYQSLNLPNWQPARLLLSLIQGAGMKWAILSKDESLRKPIPTTNSGIDLIEKLASLGQQHGWRFYLLGGDPGVAQEAADRLQKDYPTLNILGAEEGIAKGRFDDASLRKQVAERIGQTRPDVVLVAFGAPRQDLFIAEHAQRLRAPLMMGVGGSFDFLAARIQRAPRWLQAVGLEWLWRLAQEPWRIQRIVNAVIVFPWLVFLARQQTK